MNNFVTLVRIRIKTDGSDIIAAVKYAYDPDPNSAEHKALLKQYFNLQHTDMDDATLVYHAVFIIDKDGVVIKGEAFDYRVPEEQEV